MKPSYKKINYALRPAKCIERKMLCEAFRCLSDFRYVESYRYIGFGSVYFSDFTLFHKELNLCQMKSIEHNEDDKDRCEFNRPFQCIDLIIGESTDILSQIDWNEICTIAWLDYDDKLTNQVLADIKLVCSHCSPGSIIVITVNAQPIAYEKDGEDREARMNQLIKQIGEEKIPTYIRENDLIGWKLAGVYKRIIQNEIEETLVVRNGTRPSNLKIHYRQLFNFNYADGAKMLSTGGIIYDEGQTGKLEGCGFNKLSFIKNGDDPYLIEVPNLTLREIRYLNSQLPTSDPSSLINHGLSLDDVEKFARIYRYFPSFAEADI